MMYLRSCLQHPNGITDTETVPGEGKQGKNFDEYQVDKDALSDLIISMFYEKIQ